MFVGNISHEDLDTDTNSDTSGNDDIDDIDRMVLLTID